MRSMALAALFFLFLPTHLIAEHIYIDQVVKVNFAPEDAFLFVDVPNKPTIRAMGSVSAVAGSEGAGESKGTATEWLVGAKIPVYPDVKVISFSIVLAGAGGDYAFVPPQSWALSKRELFGSDHDKLREHLLTRKKVLQSWKVQVDAQEATLNRLRSDAEVIADIGKILDVKEDAVLVAADLSALERDIEGLKFALREVRGIKQPKNYAKREIELTQQVAELAQIARLAEGGEGDRRNVSEASFQDKIALIEATRFDDLQMLEDEYKRLSDKLHEIESANAVTSNY